VIGAGNVLWAYLQLLDRLASRGLVTVDSICCRSRRRWPEIHKRRPGASLVLDPLEVVDSDIDMAVVITSSDSHAELTRLALEHDKHVLVEKPFAPSRGEGEELVALAADRGVHLVAAPFVHLAPTFRALWTRISDGVIGPVHSARALYGTPGGGWNTWSYTSGGGALPELGIYNLKSLTSLCGPVTEVFAIEDTYVKPRYVSGVAISDPVADVSHVLLRHVCGTISSVVASTAIQRYNRPAIELYGTDGTANLLGDDWDPTGIEIWATSNGYWEHHDSLDPTWLWTDGVRELVMALRDRRAPLANVEQDLHLLEVMDAAASSSRRKVPVEVRSRFEPIDLRLNLSDHRAHIHDHRRPPDEQ